MPAIELGAVTRVEHEERCRLLRRLEARWAEARDPRAPRDNGAGPEIW